jgi:hypothetical protein
MKALSRKIKTFANSVVAKADGREAMVLAVALLTTALAVILESRKRGGSVATSIGCDPKVFHRRLARTLANIS